VGRISPFLIALMLFAGSAARAENLSPRAFTDAVAAAATVQVPSAQAVVKGDLQLEARGPGGASITSDLGNTYELYLRSPPQLDDLVRQAVGALADVVRYGQAKVDRSRIIPVLKPERS
jgi:hypothetical protein